jgi:hypothetical protein
VLQCYAVLQPKSTVPQCYTVLHSATRCYYSLHMELLNVNITSAKE